MYIARDSNGTLVAFARKPKRRFYSYVTNEGWWYSDWDEGIQLDKEDDCYSELRWEDEPIKVIPMAVTDNYELKKWWIVAKTLPDIKRAFAKPAPAENFAYNNHKDEGFKVWEHTRE